jgi:hypothetical protein
MRLSLSILFSLSLVMIISCEDSEDFLKRKTVATIIDEFAIIEVVYRKEGSKNKYQLYFSIPNNSYSKLTPLDSTMLRNFFAEEMETPGPYLHYAGFAYSYYYLEIGQPQKISVRISGEVKEKKSKDDMIGYPFVLTSIEKIRFCPLDYKIFQVSHSLQDTNWQLIGFVDSQDNIIFSPTCEFNNVTVNFSSSLLVNAGGYSYPSVNPQARFLNLSTGIRMNSTQGSYAYIPVNSNRFVTDYYIRELISRPCYTCGGITADVTKDMWKVSKMVFGLLAIKDTIDFSINSNILTLHNVRKNERAIFKVE